MEGIKSIGVMRVDFKNKVCYVPEGTPQESFQEEIDFYVKEKGYSVQYEIPYN